MKVYGGTFFHNHKQVRGIFAGTQKQLSAVVGQSVYYLRNYWCETGNKKEIEIAMSDPGVLFWCPNNYRSDNVYQKAAEQAGAVDAAPQCA